MNETMVDAKVTYALEHAGRFYVIVRVPARMCRETGEQCFAPETVERIQALIRNGRKPDHVIETPVYKYA
ncbi:MAG: hypothetical protein C4547_14990 [Phycisphaerales bacterium]|nr:MAG: hypothetical protein C4547_14990 [Phycisphaerales bacterium]